MIRELLRPGRNKLAVAASVALVGLLTVLSLWTNHTAERQTRIERKVEVQHTEVIQALCDKPFTQACVRHAFNVIKTCVATPKCAVLLADVPSSEAESGFVGINRHRYTTHNSSSKNGSGLAQPPNHTGPDKPHPKPPGHHRHPPAATGSPPEEPPKKLPNGKEFPGKGKANGLLGCTLELEIGCAAEEVGRSAGVVLGGG